ncbi:MAG TPA: hypothetical protein PLB89_15260 [Flavobacteriales bacterium]|nr:hypothetical protein [Flavobacteriales bacterium]
MNRRLLLLVVLVLLGGLAWWISSRSGPSTLDRPLSDFAVADTAGVTRIYIADKQGRHIDLKRTDRGWSLNDTFMAKPHDVTMLLRTFKRVEVKSPVPKAAEAHTLRVMGAASKKVEIYEGGDVPSKIWIVGHGTQDHFGTYMLLEKPGEGRSNAPFIMGMGGFIGTLFQRFHTKLDDWRDTEVYRFTDQRELATVELRTPLAPANSYRIDQDPDGRFSLLDHQGRPYAFDTVLVHGAVLSLKQVNFERIERLKRTTRDSLLGATPSHILQITDRTGKKNTTKIWYLPYTGPAPTFDRAQPLFDDIRMYALVQDTLVVVMQRPQLERVLQPISGFMR